MNIITHESNHIKIAEVVSESLIINGIQDGIDLIGNIYYQGFDRLILHEENITPDFFDLQNKMAGEILQKFSNYRMRLSIVGDFSKFTRQSIRDFIFESNKHGWITFVGTLEEAIERLGYTSR